MGMFDYYVPVPAIGCPACSVPLHGWQGKGAHCLLLTWRQGETSPRFHYPHDHPWNVIPEGACLPDGDLSIYTTCENCHRWVDAEIYVHQGVWDETGEVSV